MVDKDKTMRDFFEEEGYNTPNLLRPAEVSEKGVVGGITLVIYTNWYDTSATEGNSKWRIEEIEVDESSLFTTEEIAEESDGRVTYPENSPVEYVVKWGETGTGVPRVVPVDYQVGDKYDFNRKKSNVLGLSDEFIRFKKN